MAEGNERTVEIRVSVRFGTALFLQQEAEAQARSRNTQAGHLLELVVRGLQTLQPEERAYLERRIADGGEMGGIFKKYLGEVMGRRKAT